MKIRTCIHDVLHLQKVFTKAKLTELQEFAAVLNNEKTIWHKRNIKYCFNDQTKSAK